MCFHINLEDWSYFWYLLILKFGNMKDYGVCVVFMYIFSNFLIFFFILFMVKTLKVIF